jgi:hypothetical protein
LAVATPVATTQEFKGTKKICRFQHEAIKTRELNKRKN